VTQEIKKIKTTEELFKWQEELYTSEQYAVSGKPILDNERDKLVADYLEPHKYQQQLEEVRAYKQKLLEKVEWSNQREQLLLSEIQGQHNQL
jgi:adenine-specific DNA methylase